MGCDLIQTAVLNGAADVRQSFRCYAVCFLVAHGLRPVTGFCLSPDFVTYHLRRSAVNIPKCETMLWALSCSSYSPSVFWRRKSPAGPP
jgi:hypothetical protein